MRTSTKSIVHAAQDGGYAVGAFNKDALHWLGFCGASFHEEITIGGERFIPFTLERGQ